MYNNITISQLYAKYHFGAIHTAGITEDKVPNQDLCSTDIFCRLFQLTDTFHVFVCRFLDSKLQLLPVHNAQEGVEAMLTVAKVCIGVIVLVKYTSCSVC